MAPRLPYMYYILLNTPAYKIAHRKSKRDEIRKALSEEWKKVNESEREVFLKMGEDDQLRYEKEMDVAANG